MTVQKQKNLRCHSKAGALTVAVAFAFTGLSKAASASDLQYSVLSDHVTITGCDANAAGALDIPAVIDGRPVTNLAAYSFSNCAKLNSINIPNSVTTIGYSAFSGVFVTSITIPGSVIYVSPAAFAHCPELVSLTAQKGVRALGNDAFTGCSKLSNVNLPDGMTYLGERVFAQCSALQQITLPKDIKTVSREAFGSDALRKVVMLGALDIGEYAFEGNAQLTSVQFPPNLESIQAGAFAGCPLASLELPASLNYLGSAAFLSDPLRRVYFLGDAPHYDGSPFSPVENPKATVFYFYGKTGFTYPKWNGCRTDYIRPVIGVELPGGKRLVDEISFLSYGTQKVGTSTAWKSVKVVNSGNYRFDILGARMNGPNKSEFMLDYFPRTTLAPGASLLLKIRFKPKTNGPRKATLQIDNSIGAKNTFDLSLTGTGKK